MTQNKIFKIKLKIGDKVTVRTGKYKGKSGVISAVWPKLNKVTVEGINIQKRHLKPNKAYPQGTILEKPAPIWVSKLGVIDPTTNKLSRIAYTIDKTNTKVRVYAKSRKALKS